MNTDLLTERLEKIGWQLSANQLEGILEDASKNNVAYSDFLNSILMTEIEHRESTELSKRIKRARLPYFKTLEDFDFALQPSINEKRVREVMTCRFIDCVMQNRSADLCDGNVHSSALLLRKKKRTCQHPQLHPNV